MLPRLRLLNPKTAHFRLLLESRRAYADSPNNPNNLSILSFLNGVWKNPSKPSKHLMAIQNGATRNWDLGDAKNRYVCIGGIGPSVLESQNLSKRIDFYKEDYNKLQIEILKCPQLLVHKLTTTFPKVFEREKLQIIKLSYHLYSNLQKGRADCLAVANHITMKLNEEGEFAFYSGAAIQNANNEILFHKNKLFKTTNNEIHATVNSRNGYLHIDNLTADEIGIIYTDYGFVDIYQFQDWIEDRIRDDQ